MAQLLVTDAGNAKGNSEGQLIGERERETCEYIIGNESRKEGEEKVKRIGQETDKGE